MTCVLLCFTPRIDGIDALGQLILRESSDFPRKFLEFQNELPNFREEEFTSPTKTIQKAPQNIPRYFVVYLFLHVFLPNLNISSDGHRSLKDEGKN